MSEDPRNRSSPEMQRMTQRRQATLLGLPIAILGEAVVNRFWIFLSAEQIRVLAWRAFCYSNLYRSLSGIICGDSSNRMHEELRMWFAVT